MSNIRIKKLSIKNSNTIEIVFTNNVNNNVSVDNFSISRLDSSGTLDILSLSIDEKTVTLTTRLMVSRAYYKLVISNGENFGNRGETLIDDGATNHYYFLGPEFDNEIRDAILKSLPDIYDIENGTLIYSAIDSSSQEIFNVQNRIDEVDSSKYLSIEVENEQIVRGSGPTDRFSKEGVYQVTKVSSSESGITENSQISFDEFPSDPVSLQQILTDEEVTNVTDDTNSFSGLNIKVSNRPVIKVTSIKLTRGTTEYEYDIEQYRYGLLENKYDSNNSYQLLDLEDNEISLSSSAVGPTFPLPQGSDVIEVTYYYKKVGRDIDEDTLEIYSIEESTRESVPAVATTFFLDNAPIVDSSGNSLTLGGITWLDPAQNYESGLNHPSFVSEISFSTTSFPSEVGEWSCNYETGQVFLYGEDGSGTDGTTTVPPVATYNYKKEFRSGIDYIFSSDIDEIASLPDGELRGNSGTIDFNYEDTFANGTDFEFTSHVEVINERVNNNLIDTVGLYTQNFPVNEVFRIYNETTGEIYNPTRISGNKVYFSSINPPRTVDITREAVRFKTELRAQLVAIEEITITGEPFVALKVETEHTQIGSATGNFIGSSINSSLTFSNTDLFINEYYFDSEDDLATNLGRLTTIGDYVVDYLNGIIYVAITSGSILDVGDASYSRAIISPLNKHILRVDDVYRSISVSLDNSATFNVSDVSDETVDISDWETVGETKVSGSPILVSSGTVVVSSDASQISGIYQVTDLKTTNNPINFGEGSIISSSEQTTITLASGGVLIEDSGLTIQTSGSKQYVSANRISTMFSSGLCELKSAISIVDETTGVNYFNQGSDGYISASENRIYLPSTSSASGKTVTASYKAQLKDAAAVLVDYVSGRMYIDYTYVRDEILINYEYGDNVLDWSISNSLNEGETYYVNYKYGGLRNSLRDNFGILSGIEELTTISDNLDRETYRNALIGALQTFPKGPTIPSIETLVESLTEITPNIIETVFLEWILGRDHLHLKEIELGSNNIDEIPTYDNGKFGKGLLLDKDGQTAILPTISNIKFSEGTWESFIIPNWNGIENDAYITFDIKQDGYYVTNSVFVGSNNTLPDADVFTLNKDDAYVLGRPSKVGQTDGIFIWFDTSENKWRFRVSSPVGTVSNFTGLITTDGGFHNVSPASTLNGLDGYDEYSIIETNDMIRSTETKINFNFTVDAYDFLNTAYNSYDTANMIGYDGIDFQSDREHYILDTGLEENKNRISLFKDHKGFLKFKIYDNNSRAKVLSANISDWEALEKHHIAISWKIGTIEMADEMHMFIDGREVPNTYLFRGYLDTPNDAIFMDAATEILASSVTSPTIGGNDLLTTSGSNIVQSLSSTFVTSGVNVNDRFLILDETTDGLLTQETPYVYVKSVVSETQLELKDGNGIDFNLSSTLGGVRFSVNPIFVETVSNVEVEKLLVFSNDGGNETELYSSSTVLPDYEFYRDGYQDYVYIYNGIPLGGDALLRSYGLNMSRCREYIYLWADGVTNILNSVTPTPTSVSKIDITKIIAKRTSFENPGFVAMATGVGGHLVTALSSNLDYCQPSNSVTGRKLKANLFGTQNINYNGINEITFVGTTYGGDAYETLTFSIGNSSPETTNYFTTLTDVVVTVTPIDITKLNGSIEVRESNPLTYQENGGNYAEVHLSVQDQDGLNGEVSSGSSLFSDAYARFGPNDIGKYINITSPVAIAGTYTIQDVSLDASGQFKDAYSVTLNTTFSDAYSNIEWRQINTSYGDSGFANGLITLETVGSGGQPFLLGKCWYEIDFPTKLIIPWGRTSEELYIGSNMLGSKQANAVIDEMRILDEVSTDTGRGEDLPSSGRSITTDALAVSEFEATSQTLGLFHFNESVENSASFYTTFAKTFKQSENSVNSLFGQSGVFNIKKSYEIDNSSVFNNDQGTIEFWVSPILDTYNDPTNRYYIDLSPQQQVAVTALTNLSILLPVRARSIASIKLSDGSSDNDYYIGGSLGLDGKTITLVQPLPPNKRSVIVTYVPLNNSGDRFSILKNDVGHLVLYVSASGKEFQISVPVFWKKNTWHRVMAGWDLNNTDNQDQLILLVDGTEGGVVRYGTGLLYGGGSMYGQPTVWGSANAGTTVSRNILADINLLDEFNTVHVGADFTGQFTAMARMDNIRFSNTLRDITYFGESDGEIVSQGPGRLIGKDLLYTSNTNTAFPVIEDALTSLLIDFNTTQEENEHLISVRNASSGIFDFYVEVIDTFDYLDTTLKQELLENLIQKLKPAHTRAFVSFTK